MSKKAETKKRNQRQRKYGTFSLIIEQLISALDKLALNKES